MGSETPEFTLALVENADEIHTISGMQTNAFIHAILGVKLGPQEKWFALCFLALLNACGRRERKWFFVQVTDLLLWQISTHTWAFLSDLFEWS